MTTAGPELRTFIDPSLTWKTVSKGRNTSRRSRRSTSKNLIMFQEQGKRSPKRSNGAQLSESENSEKSESTIHGRRFGGKMEHIPIKKRRFLLRSPSPPPQSPTCLGDSEGPATGHSYSDQHTCSDFIAEPPVKGIDSSVGTDSNKLLVDAKVDNNDIVMSSDGLHSSGEDFSGIAILAAAACSGKLDSSVGDVKTSQTCDILKGEQNESFAPVPSVKESSTCFESPYVLENEVLITKGEGSMSILPNGGSEVSSWIKCNDEVGMRQVADPLKGEQKEIVASETAKIESIECSRSPDSLAKGAECAKEDPSADLSNDCNVGKSVENIVSRDCRLHWDLNTVMDEWDEPLDDAGVDLGENLLEARPTSTTSCQHFENVEGSVASERSEATVSGSPITANPLSCGEGESMALPVSGGFNDDSPAGSRMAHRLEVSTGLATTIVKGCNESGHVVNSSDHLNVPSQLVSSDTDIDHSLSLGLNGTVKLSFEETHNAAAAVSGDLNVLAAKESPTTTQIVPPEKHVLDFLPVPPLRSALGAKNSGDCKFSESLKRRNLLDLNYDKVPKVTCESGVANLGTDKCVSAAVDASEMADLSCKVDNVNNSDSHEGEFKHGVLSPIVESHLPRPENPTPESDDAVAAHCSNKLDDLVACSATIHEKQAMDIISTKEIGDKPVDVVEDASKCDSLINDGSEGVLPKISHHSGAIDAFSKQVNAPVNKSSDVLPESRVCGSHDSNNEDSSQVTENTGNGAELEGGYDSHLEDGELRESVGQFWEENEGEDGETEHVDYDSDNREGAIFFEDANDSVQLSGEVLAGECEKQTCRSDNLSSADDQPSSDKNVEENCSLRVQGCLLKINVTDSECTKNEFTTLKVCSMSQLGGAKREEMDHQGCKSPGMESNSAGKELGDGALRNVRGASPSGRGLQSSERRSIDTIRRSRSSNFDCTRHGDVSDDSLPRSRPPPRINRLGEHSWNPDLKGVANSGMEDGGEKMLRASDDSSPRLFRSRIISTTRSGVRFVRRGSPGGRDNDYSMGMIKARDSSPDNSTRGRFDRFNNGINRGFREGYRRPGMYEAAKSSGPMLNHFGKRQRSFSPIGGRAEPHFPRVQRKSRSRSRTRSPDFRPEARMVRPRLPYQSANNHATEHMRERRSPVRQFIQGQRFETTGSPGRMRSDDCIRPMMRPIRFHDTTTTSGRGHDYEEGDDYRRKPFLQRNHRRSRSRSRSCSPDFRPDARMGMRMPYQSSGDHVRERRSPVRVFRPRYDDGGSPVRLRSDDCVRPIMRPVRFPEAAQPGRAHEYNNNNGDEYRRKPRNIFERIHPIRHYEMEGDARRFQYDDEEVVPTQSFRRNENYVRGGERRPVEVLRNNREERGNNARFNSERVFYSGPKQFGGMRDYADDAPLPRRVRP